MGHEEGEFIEAYRELDKIQRNSYLDYDPLIIVYSKLCYNLFIKNQSLSLEERKNLPDDEYDALVQGFKEYHYKELILELGGYAELEGIETKKSKNKQWPQSNIELRDQSLKLSLRLLNARGYSVEVTHGVHNEILYIVGTREGLERYRSIDDLGKVDKNQDIVIRECIDVLQEYDNTEILFEHLLRLTSSQNSQVALYLDNKFKLRDSRKLKPILEILLEHPFIEQAKESPITLRWLGGGNVGNGNGNNEDKDNGANGDDNKDESNKSGLFLKEASSIGSPIEHSSIQTVAKTASVCGNEKKFLEQLQNNFQPQTKKNSCQNKFSNHETEAIFATECIEDSSIKQDTNQPIQSLEEAIPELRNFASFDCEWHREGFENKGKGRANDIYCFCLVDNNGNIEKLHINRFGGDHLLFMTAILESMEKYDMLVGYYIFGDHDIDSDLKHLEINCAKVGLEERFARLKERTRFIDLYKIFSNRVVQGFLQATYDTDYRGYGLNEVASAYLQNGEGKKIRWFIRK